MSFLSAIFDGRITITNEVDYLGIKEKFLIRFRPQPLRNSVPFRDFSERLVTPVLKGLVERIMNEHVE